MQGLANGSAEGAAVADLQRRMEARMAKLEAQAQSDIQELEARVMDQFNVHQVRLAGFDLLPLR